MSMGEYLFLDVYLTFILDKKKGNRRTSEKWSLIKSWRQPKRESPGAYSYTSTIRNSFPLFLFSSTHWRLFTIHYSIIYILSSAISWLPLFSGIKLNTSIIWKSRHCPTLEVKDPSINTLQRVSSNTFNSFNSTARSLSISDTLEPSPALPLHTFNSCQCAIVPLYLPS